MWRSGISGRHLPRSPPKYFILQLLFFSVCFFVFCLVPSFKRADKQLRIFSLVASLASSSVIIFKVTFSPLCRRTSSLGREKLLSQKQPLCLMVWPYATGKEQVPDEELTPGWSTTLTSLIPLLKYFLSVVFYFRLKHIWTHL